MRRLIVANAAVAAAYWSVAVLVRWYFASYQMWPAPLWLSAAVSMFAAFSMGRWSWPGIFLGSLLTNAVSFKEPLFWSAVVSGGNTIAPLLAVELVRRKLRTEDVFSRVGDVFWFGIAASVHGMISASVGAFSMWVRLSEGPRTLPARWFYWTLSDAAASLLLVPLFLLLRYHPLSLHRIRKHPVEFLTTSAISIATVVYLLSQHTGLLAADAGASFLILLPLLWMSVRFSASVAYPMFVAVMAVVVGATLAGLGPYSGVEKGGTFFIFAQMAIGFGGAVLLLGAASQEQWAAEKALRHLNQDLENRVEQRTAELRQSKERLETAAYHDALTGLPNRRLLERSFATCRSAAERKGTQVACLLLDLDHFKEINDNLGHDAGDVLLVETGRKLTAALREYDVVARMGGDEFAILLPDAGDPSIIDSVCARIIQALTDRIFFNGKFIVTSPSIGVALYPDHGDVWQDVYRAADTALYVAKRAGRCRWEWYSEAAVEAEPK